jgi:hypothetical protein
LLLSLLLIGARLSCGLRKQRFGPFDIIHGHAVFAAL